MHGVYTGQINSKTKRESAQHASPSQTQKGYLSLTDNSLQREDYFTPMKFLRVFKTYLRQDPCPLVHGQHKINTAVFFKGFAS